MERSRKRAARACRVCRHRKRKCDGKLPSCTTCENLQTLCSYDESAHSRHARAQRLERIESSLQAHTDALANILGSSHSLDVNRDSSHDENLDNASSLQQLAPGDGMSPELPQTSPAPSLPVSARGSLPALNDDSTPPTFSIPLGHQTSTSSLLVLPQVRALAGTFPHDSFFRLEARRSVPDCISFSIDSPSHQYLPPVDRRTTDRLLQHFFSLVHTWHPLFDHETFMELYNKVLDRGIGLDMESALCLVVFALGAVASEPTQRSDSLEQEMPGASYFQPAYQIFVAAWMNSSSGDVMLAQGLVLSALYVLYILRPLQGWRLIHMASTTIQQTLNQHRSGQISNVQHESIVRVCWSCFLIECDNLAEFDHPRSGIEPLIDKMPFPQCGNPPDLNMERYLTELSVRCLLNRIHHSLYFTYDASEEPLGTPAEVDSMSLQHPPSASLIRICAELERQLKTWYDALPDIISPDLSRDRDENRDVHACLLRLRYWSARCIIYRPFIMYATSTTADLTLSQIILDNCEACLSSCRAFIYSLVDLLSTPSPYTYYAIQCCLASILLLTLASSSPILQHLVQDIDVLQSLAIELLGMWKNPESSVEFTYEIAVSIRTKQRLGM